MDKGWSNIRNAAELLAAATIIGVLVTACGGGGGGAAATTPPATSATTLTGVVAVGSPIVGGTVTVKCASGSTLTATTNYAGAYSITWSGQTLPCVAELSGGSINGVANTITYHSIATALGTMNVTPLTDLMVANLTGSATPSTWFASPTGLSAFTSTQVNTALTNTVTALGISTPLGANNPITTTFSPVNGGVMDDLLIALKTSLTSGGATNTYSALLTDAAATGFTAPSFTTSMTVAYATTVSGGATAPVGTSGSPITSSYVDFNYLQDVNGAASAVTSTINDDGTGILTNNMVFGPTPTTASFDFAGGGYTWPGLSYGNGFNSNSIDANVPAAIMLCQSGTYGGGASYGRGKSIDVLVTNTATPITNATLLAGLSFNTYYEDCGTSTTQNGQSASIDASGNATFHIFNGTTLNTLNIPAPNFTPALNGYPYTMSFGGGTTGYITYNAYSYTTASGATKYVLVEHGGNGTSTGLSVGYVGIWLQ